MDPLSITASIIAVLQAANAVISTCYDFKALLKDTPWALTRIISEVKDLRNVLETLDQLTEPTRNSTTSVKKKRRFEILCDPQNGPLSTCLCELNALEQLLGTRSRHQPGSLTKALLQAVTWQTKEKEVRLSLEKIERCKSTLNLAITADEASVLHDIQDMTSSMAAAVESMGTNIEQLVQRQEVKELDQAQKSILHWLSATDPWESHNAAVKAHQEGTNSWFMDCEEFNQWITAKRAFLWLSGFPGAGKTILFSNTVNYLCRQLNSLQDGTQMAFCYCDFRRSETQDVVNMAGSLLSQLCSHTGFIPEELEEAFHQSQSGGTTKRPTLSLIGRILEILAVESKVMLLVDALDECTQRQEAAAFLSDLQRTLPHTRVLVTSRDEPDIQAGLHSFTQVRIEDHLDEVNEDVQSYITRRLSSDRKLQWLNSSVREDISSLLIEKSCGMFRWVQCQLDAIANLRTVKAIRTALNELPKGLDETYDKILIKISPPDIEIVRRILLWVSFTVFPLTLREVHEAVAIEPDLDHLDEESRLRSPQDILDLCSSLVHVSEEGHIRLAHLSVKEYLTSPGIRKKEAVSVFALESNSANLELAKYCLTYLFFNNLSSGPCPTSQTYTERMIRYPLLQYAAVCWTYFVRETTPTPELRQFISRFFSPLCRSTFMSWVQVLNAVHASWDFYPRHTTPLYYAASFGLTETVADMITNPEVDLNAPGSRFGGTALHAAVLRQHTSVMKVLLDAGADPNQPDWNKIYPLHTAASYGNEEVVKLLLDSGASPEVHDEEERTPGEWALEAGSLEAARLVFNAIQLPFREGTEVTGVSFTESWSDDKFLTPSKASKSIVISRTQDESKNSITDGLRKLAATQQVCKNNNENLICDQDISIQERKDDRTSTTTVSHDDHQQQLQKRAHSSWTLLQKQKERTTNKMP
ncbi:uncharacterized protein Z518_07446 [Rhinocladiella mackenziei CBS 650.93]|uniref:NACHT domain-containing protein n=1 Tax=Rhinocladiella mackenziei CBS 650.93 TaxID=1442369 RepID=A0A0D2H0E5_9EURO|nr:uncharacterized protein Z518_07446 [Rhinocladiella mackenziei CBS 650.93]KIX03893.1 hypothetical protein Z518_07446 [Rhinocladiella mackenziei CBS 650.93]